MLNTVISVGFALLYAFLLVLAKFPDRQNGPDLKSHAICMLYCWIGLVVIWITVSYVPLDPRWRAWVVMMLVDATNIALSMGAISLVLPGSRDIWRQFGLALGILFFTLDAMWFFPGFEIDGHRLPMGMLWAPSLAMCIQAYFLMAALMYSRLVSSSSGPKWPERLLYGIFVLPVIVYAVLQVPAYAHLAPGAEAGTFKSPADALAWGKVCMGLSLVACLCTLTWPAQLTRFFKQPGAWGIAVGLLGALGSIASVLQLFIR